MQTCKLTMGVSEALIGVWATVWVQSNAPRDAQARWMGFASISAGAGNGMGSCVAGLCAKRFGYGFAFFFQSFLLFGLWVIMLLSPTQYFNFGEGNENEEAVSATTSRGVSWAVPEDEVMNSLATNGLPRTWTSGSAPELMMHAAIAKSMTFDSTTGRRQSFVEEAKNNSDLSLWQSMKIVLSTPLWLYTALSISLSCFITSSVAFLWQNTTNSVWDFNEVEATFSFLFTTGIGGLLGVALGPKVFDEYLQGFATASGRAKCLRACCYATLGSALLSTMCTILLLTSAWRMFYYEAVLPRGGVLAGMLGGVFLLFALLNSMQGTLYGINTDSATPETKTAAAGLTVSMQNIVGFAFGPLLPSMAAECVQDLITRLYPTEDERGYHGASFASGMALALCVTWLLLFCVHRAAAAARCSKVSTADGLGESFGSIIEGEDVADIVARGGHFPL